MAVTAGQEILPVGGTEPELQAVLVTVQAAVVAAAEVIILSIAKQVMVELELVDMFLSVIVQNI